MTLEPTPTTIENYCGWGRTVNVWKGRVNEKRICNCCPLRGMDCMTTNGEEKKGSYTQGAAEGCEKNIYYITTLEGENRIPWSKAALLPVPNSGTGS